MKTLFCSPIPTENPRLGASRVIIDLAEAWQDQGWNCDVYSAKGEKISYERYPAHLAEYLSNRALDYDVVDFPYNCVPWIEERHSEVLKVARSVILKEHCYFEQDPSPPFSVRNCLSLASRLHSLASRRRLALQTLAMQKLNIERSDLVSLGNQKDKDCLAKLGVPASKIQVLPYGLTQTHRNRLLKCTPQVTNVATPTIAFIGTFDYRKGCLDIPKILTEILKHYPAAQLKLIGTQGMCQDTKSVRRFFPKSIRPHVSVIQHFSPEQLRDLLTNCSVGVFPSYREGFGIGVLEMLAAGLPVVAYDSPGPCDILPKMWLARKGDHAALARKTLELLMCSEERRKNNVVMARSVSRHFSWVEIAKKTYAIYSNLSLKA